MATPYSTPGYSKVPRPTPSSVALSSRATLRAPIHNPYDKFTQPEFDAWIGDLTGALKRALGREEPIPITTPISQSEDTHPGDVSAYGDVDDSFAEIKARRAAKGKERAREEDFSDDDEEPGSPEIVVISSDEDDEDADAAHDESGVEDEHVYSDEGSEEDALDHDDETQLSFGIEYEVSDDEDEVQPVPVVSRSLEETLAEEEYDSVDGAVEETDVYEHSPGPFSPRSHDALEIEAVEDRDEDGAEDGEADEIVEDEEVVEQPPQHLVEIPDVWEGPSTYAEDFYSGGDVRVGSQIEGSAHLLPGEMDAAPSMHVAEYEDFPPADVIEHPVDISDPWTAPRAFAEDLYTGGEILGDTSGLSPSHLTTAQSTPQANEGMIVATGLSTPLELDMSETSRSKSPTLQAESSVTSMPALFQPPEEAFDPNLLDDLYADLGQPVSASPDEDVLDIDQISYPASGTSPVGEQSPLPKLHDKSSSPPRASLQGHIDWNWPPAFQTPLSAEQALKEASISSVALEEEKDQFPQPTNLEVQEINDDEDDTEGFFPNSNETAVLMTDEPSLSVNVAFEENQSRTPTSPPESEDVIGVNSTQVRDDIGAQTLEDDVSILAQPSGIGAPSSNADAVTSESLVTAAPALPEDVGFGDLPPVLLDMQESTTDNASDVFDIFANLNNVNKAIVLTPDDDTFGEQLAEADFLNFAEVEEAPVAAAFPAHSRDDIEDPHGTFAMPLSAEGGEYFVTEVTTDDEHVQEPEPDVMTDHDDLPAAGLEYTVEEMVTDGRRTEEPDILITSVSPRDEEPSTLDSARISRGTTPDVQSVLRDFTSATAGLSLVDAESDSEDESPRRRRPRFLLRSRSRSAASSDKGRSVIASPVGNMLKLPVTKFRRSIRTPKSNSAKLNAMLPPSSELVTTSTFEGVAHAASSPAERHAVDIPAPVSADPTVPDPSSVWGTPRATSPPIEPSSNPRVEERMPVEPSGLVKMTLKQPVTQSASGLFTPATETDSSPASPSVFIESRDDAGVAESVGPPPTLEHDVHEDSHNEPILDLQPSVSHETETPAISQEDHPDEHDVHDADADGDLDSEYHDDHTPEDSQPPETVLAPIEVDTFTLMGSGGKIATRAADDDTNSRKSASTGPPPNSSLLVDHQETVTPISHTDTSTKEVLSTSLQNASVSPEPDPRPLKRRRSSPSPAPRDILPSNPAQASVQPEQPLSDAPESGNGGHADHEDDIESVASSRNSESAKPTSKSKRQTNSSVSRASSTTSSRSTATESSSARVTAILLPPPFLHADGVLHHHHGKAPPQHSLRLSIPVKTNESSSSEPTRSQAHHPEVSNPSLSTSLAPPSSSYVTRSNCRFHKISVPLDEDGPRVFFVVPGCSLTNTELMEEEEIEDHGDATLADNARLVPNVEALDFSSYLISVLRQLVRVDYLREQEIFYLPQDGENIGLKPKPKSPTKTKHSRDSVSGRSSMAAGSSSTRTIRNLPRSPVKSILGRASSVSTVSSIARGSHSGAGSVSIAGSFSGDEMSEADDGPPKPKRRKGDKRKALPNPENLSFKARRSKRLSADASAYKPEHVDSDDSSDEERPKKTRRKTQRGLKRARTSDARQDENEEKKNKSKRRKVQSADNIQLKREAVTEE